MPQEFQVLQCYKCSTFQVHQVKKSNKWNCKLCGEKQSVKKVFGRGSGSDCRHHVQKLNTLRGEIDTERESESQNSIVPQEEQNIIREGQNSIVPQEEQDRYYHHDNQYRTEEAIGVRGLSSKKWSKYLDVSREETTYDQSDTDDVDGSYTTSREKFDSHSKQNRKRKRKNSNDLASRGKLSNQRSEEPSLTWNEDTHSRYYNSRLTSSAYEPSVDMAKNRTGDESFHINNTEYGHSCVLEDNVISFNTSGNENISLSKKFQECPRSLNVDLNMKMEHAGNRTQTLAQSSKGKSLASKGDIQASVLGSSKWDKFTIKTTEDNADDNDDDDNSDDIRIELISRTRTIRLPSRDNMYHDVQYKDNSIGSSDTGTKTESMGRKYFVCNHPLRNNGNQSDVLLSGLQSFSDSNSFTKKNVPTGKENSNCTLHKPNFSVGDVHDDDFDLEF